MNPEHKTETGEIVSFDDEQLQLVSENDEVIGYRSKEECHDGEGILHRAFSIFIFNVDGELLLQRRSGDKRLWPMYWSNTVCSHPRKGEEMEEAIQRRLREEFGFSTELTFLYKFQYHARFGKEGSEREICSVYAGRYDGNPEPNEHEIAEWRTISPQQLEQEMDEYPDRFTPWFQMEWRRIRDEYMDLIEDL